MKKSVELRGILPALITPFTENGSAIDTAALAKHATALVDAGCGGLIPGGTTGEFTSLSNAERKLLHQSVVEAVNGRVPVIAQTGALTAEEAAELSVHAQSVGAAAVMVIPPFFDHLTFEELCAYYEEVAGAVDIPVMIYNIPGASGQTLTPAQLGAIGRIPGVNSIKDSGADATALSELLIRHGGHLQVLNGWDTFTFFGLAAGAQASVWGAANIFPDLAVELFDTVAVRGDLVAGRALWARLFPVVQFLETRSYTTRVKVACGLMGVQTGPVRRPLLAAPASDVLELRSRMLASGLQLT